MRAIHATHSRSVLEQSFEIIRFADETRERSHKLGRECRAILRTARVANWELYAISVVGSVGKRGELAHDGFRAIAGVRRVTRRRVLVLVVLFQKQEIDT